MESVVVKKLLAIGFLATISSALAATPADMGEMLRVIEQDPPEQFEEVLTRFVSHAQAGDIDNMVLLTSDVTVSQIGRSELAEHYKTDLSLALKKCGSLSQGGDVVHVTQEQSGTGPGWVYVKSCTNPEVGSVRLQFVILRESSKIVVASVRAL